MTNENTHNEKEQTTPQDDAHGDIKIGNLTYTASAVLSAVDPIAYRCGHSDYNSDLIGDAQIELKDLEEQFKELDGTTDEVKA